MKKKTMLSVLAVFTALMLPFLACAHSGRTDASGGHRDNKNKSGLGSYHYHCGGHPAHLHQNGVCPYAAKSSSNTASGKTAATPKPTPSTVYASGVKITEFPQSMKAGDEASVHCTVLPSNAVNKSLTYKSDNESVVTVDRTGKLKALSPGKATITISTDNNQSSAFMIEVREVTADSIQIAHKTSELYAGETILLEATLLPDNTTDKQIHWESSDTDIASIDASGRLCAVSPGQATISAVQKDVRESFALTVKPVLAEHIEITTAIERLQKGSSVSLSAEIIPHHVSDDTVFWSVDNSTLAEIEGNTLKALEKGVVTVTATTSNGVSAQKTIEIYSNSAAGVIGTTAVLGGGGAGYCFYKRKKRTKTT